MIDKLEFMLALDREHHFGRAAESCGVTQQTLSAALKNLEQRLGVRLVQRGSRFQGFTPEGERTLEWARRIVADHRAMQQDIAGLRNGLSGHLRIAAIPTALPMVAALTTPFRAKHPNVRFTVLSSTSTGLFRLLGNLEIDAGLTYLGNEPLPVRVQTHPIYEERYQLLTAADGIFGDRATVTWAEVARVPLCLLTPQMQNRRIIDEQLRVVGAEALPMLESNSMIVLLTHVRTARWSSVMPAVLAETLELTARVRAIPIVEPDIARWVGLVVPDQEPALPMVAAFVAEARALAATMHSATPATAFDCRATGTPA